MRQQSDSPTGEDFALGEGEIAVWRIDLSSLPHLAPSELDPGLGGLDEAEIARARGFQLATAARAFVRRRQALRALLGRYLDRSAGDLRLIAGPHGKPELAPDQPPLAFNLSDSGTMVLIALMRGGEVGVDIERLRRTGDELDVARSFITPAEHATLAAQPADRTAEVFLRFWTRKEAVMKAVGRGLTLAPESFEVSLRESVPVDLP